MHEKRSAHFITLFRELGIECRRRGDGRIDNKAPLRVDGASLQIYFNEATESRDAYFAANENFYRGFGWSGCWTPADVDRPEEGYHKVVPSAGREREALESIIAHLKRTNRP